MQDPIFIVGPHRSGSTLWHNIIAIAPGVLRLTEPRFLARRGQRDFNFFLQTQSRNLETDEDVDTMVDLCFSKRSFPGLEAAFWRFERIAAAENPELKKAVVQRIRNSDRSLGAIAKAIIEEVTRFSGCDRACVKFPVDVGHIPELLRWFPNSKVVHITRDPRALAMSKSNDPSGTAIKVVEHPAWAWLIRRTAIWLSVVQYRWTAALHLRYKNLPNYKLFLYEDLLADPEVVLRRLCDFVGVKFSRRMLEPERGRHEHQPSSLTGKRQKAFDATAATRWKTVISPFDNFMISCLTRGSMRKFGYNPKKHAVFQHTKQVQPTHSGGIHGRA
jgi:hypothetical protein